MEKMKKEECWGADPVHPQKAFFKQLADLALSGLDKVAERCITGESARGGKRPRGQEGWFGPRGGGRGGGRGGWRGHGVPGHHALLENPAENNVIKCFCIGYKAEILCHCRKICYSYGMLLFLFLQSKLFSLLRRVYFFL